MKIEVRPAKPEEFWRIGELVDRIQEETRFKDTPLDMHKLQQTYQQQFENFPIIVFFALNENFTAGLGAFMVTERYWNRDLISSDLMLYVRHEFRGSTAALRLIRAYEQWAMSYQVKEINLGISTGYEVERTAQFYQKLGHKPLATSYQKEQ